MREKYENFCKDTRHPHRPSTFSKDSYERDLALWYRGLQCNLNTPVKYRTKKGLDTASWRKYIESTYPTKEDYTRTLYMSGYESFCESLGYRPTNHAEATKEEENLYSWFEGLRFYFNSNKCENSIEILEWCNDMMVQYPSKIVKAREDNINEYENYCKEFKCRPKTETSLGTWFVYFHKSLKSNGIRHYPLFEDSAYEKKMLMWCESIVNNYPTDVFYNAYHNTCNSQRALNEFYRRHSKTLNISVDKVKQIPCDELWQELQKLKTSIKPLKRKLPDLT